jgi:FMN reductase
MGWVPGGLRLVMHGIGFGMDSAAVLVTCSSRMSMRINLLITARTLIMINIAGISGSLGSPSRTRALVETVMCHLCRALPGKLDIIDLGESGHLFWQAKYPDALGDEAKALFDIVESADILVVGSPVYKGSYSGLFKHFFDLLEPKALAGKIVILTATGGSDFHALALEHQLRPLFSFFGAVTVPVTIFAKNGDFDDSKLINPLIVDRIGDSIVQAVRLAIGQIHHYQNLGGQRAAA